MALWSNVTSIGINHSGCPPMSCSSTLKPTSGLSMGRLLTRTETLMERLGSSLPGRLIIMGTQPSNGIGSPLTACTFNSSISSMISDRGRILRSGRYLSFQAQLIILTCAPASSNAVAAKPFKLHCMRAFLPMSLATAPRLDNDSTSDNVEDSGVVDKGEFGFLLSQPVLALAILKCSLWGSFSDLITGCPVAVTGSRFPGFFVSLTSRQLCDPLPRKRNNDDNLSDFLQHSLDIRRVCLS